MGYGVVWAAAMMCSAGMLAGQPVLKASTDTLTSKFDVAGIPVILRRVSANNVVAANLYLLGGTRQLTART